MADGIFFKLATDAYSLYGGARSTHVVPSHSLGDHGAMKAAAHELKAYNELLRLGAPIVGHARGLHLPMARRLVVHVPCSLH